MVVLTLPTAIARHYSTTVSSIAIAVFMNFEPFDSREAG